MKSPLAEMISSLASTSLIDQASVTPRAKSGDRADMENVLCSPEGVCGFSSVGSWGSSER